MVAADLSSSSFHPDGADDVAVASKAAAAAPPPSPPPRPQEQEGCVTAVVNKESQVELVQAEPLQQNPPLSILEILFFFVILSGGLVASSFADYFLWLCFIETPSLLLGLLSLLFMNVPISIMGVFVIVVVQTISPSYNTEPLVNFCFMWMTIWSQWLIILLLSFGILPLLLDGIIQDGLYIFLIPLSCYAIFVAFMIKSATFLTGQGISALLETNNNNTGHHPNHGYDDTQPRVSDADRAKWMHFTFQSSASSSKTLTNNNNLKQRKAGGYYYDGVDQKDTNSTNKDSSLYEDDCSNCSICGSEYQKGDEIVKLPCHHLYHDKCISSWTFNYSVCPLCHYNLASATTTTAPAVTINHEQLV